MSWNPLPSPRSAVAVALCLLAATGCKYISNTVVPSFDNKAPVGIITQYQNQTHQIIQGQSFTTSNPTKAYIVVATGFDQGGVKKVKMFREVTRVWSLGGSLVSSNTLHLGTLQQTQAGSVGQTVKNGLYTFAAVQPGSYAAPGPGPLLSVTYRVNMECEDFHGNKSYTSGPVFRYFP